MYSWREVLLECEPKRPEYYLAQAHIMVRRAKRTSNIEAQQAYLKLARRWEQLAHEARAGRSDTNIL